MLVANPDGIDSERATNARAERRLSVHGFTSPDARPGMNYLLTI